jgi:hypothetical protein
METRIAHRPNCFAGALLLKSRTRREWHAMHLLYFPEQSTRPCGHWRTSLPPATHGRPCHPYTLQNSLLASTASSGRHSSYRISGHLHAGAQPSPGGTSRQEEGSLPASGDMPFPLWPRSAATHKLQFHGVDPTEEFHRAA